MEVLLGRAERHLRPQRPIALGERPHQPEVERRVGDDVDDRRTGGEHAVLDAEVGPPTCDVVDRAVPAVDGAVVEPQLGQVRRPSGFEDGQRVLVGGDRQQRREVADVLLEQVEDRRDPTLPEPHPGPHSLRLQLLAAGVGRLLEQRDPGLAPELLAEEVRRVRAERELHTGDGLRCVPVRREPLGRRLHVELRARARRLGKDRVRGRAQQVGAAADVDADVLATRVQHLVAQQPVARVAADRVDRQVGVGQGRQDADHHQVRADGRRAALGLVEAPPEPLLEPGQPAVVQRRGRRVHLDVELPELGLELRVGDRLERLGVAEGRVARVVDQVELDLEPGHRVVGVERRLTEHPGEHVEAAPHLLAVPCPISAGELLCVDLLAHGPTVAMFQAGSPSSHAKSQATESGGTA